MDLDLNVSIWLWVGFNAVILGLLALDLGVFHRNSHVVSLKEAAIWSSVWVSLSLLFNVGIFAFAGTEAGVSFLTGYLIEYSLSIDNIFVMVLIFGYFAVPATYQHRVLFWGIVGALIMRGTLIIVGSTLLEQFHWIIYVFGLVLIFSGVRMAFQGETEMDVEKNVAVRMMRRLMPVSTEYHGPSFFTRVNGMRAATPLLLVLVVVETTDLIFAFDSIPAIFAVTNEPFLVYTSNVCAILGLRSLYFLLAGVSDKFHYLKLGLSLILVWVGVKMLSSELYHVPTVASLFVVLLILTVAVAASLMFPKREPLIVDEEFAAVLPHGESSDQ